VLISPHEQERPMLSYAAELARRRQVRGLKLNVPEATAIVRDLMQSGRTVQVLLGRMGEKPGRWTGTTRIERAGRRMLHTTVGLGPGAPAWLPPVAPRAYVSTVSVGNPRGEVEVCPGPDAVRLPLPGGRVGTAWAGELHEAVDRLGAIVQDTELLLEAAR
jgi:urease accessory protein